MDWWSAEQWKSSVRNFRKWEVITVLLPSSSPDSRLELWQSRMPPLQGLMTHSKDSPHPPFSICGDFNSPKIGSPRCHVCTNYPNSFQHSPQNSVWPQSPLRFVEDTLNGALWSSSNIKYLLYEVKQPEWESLTLNVVRIKVWDVPLSLPNSPHWCSREHQLQPNPLPPPPSD